jgi:hypothetical protein
MPAFGSVMLEQIVRNMTGKEGASLTFTEQPLRTNAGLVSGTLPQTATDFSIYFFFGILILEALIIATLA